jgi:uncharacterized oligopeptide transporter (OPT) family protein
MSRELSVRELIIAALGSVVITASSMYVALKLGALPWPTIFVIKLPSMTLGLGMYLPVFITTPIFLGGLISLAEKRFNKKAGSKNGTVIASGLLGGKAVTGVVIAAIHAAKAFI